MSKPYQWIIKMNWLARALYENRKAPFVTPLCITQIKEDNSNHTCLKNWTNYVAGLTLSNLYSEETNFYWNMNSLLKYFYTFILLNLFYYIQIKCNPQHFYFNVIEIDELFTSFFLWFTWRVRILIWPYSSLVISIDCIAHCAQFI